MQGAVILQCLFSKPSSFISCNLGRLWKLFIKHLTARVTWGMKVLFPWQNTCFCLLNVEDLVIFHDVSNWRSKMFYDVEASPKMSNFCVLPRDVWKSRWIKVQGGPQFLYRDVNINTSMRSLW